MGTGTRRIATSVTMPIMLLTKKNEVVLIQLHEEVGSLNCVQKYEMGLQAKGQPTVISKLWAAVTPKTMYQIREVPNLLR